MEDSGRNNKANHRSNPNRRHAFYLANVILLCTVTLAAIAAGGVFLWQEHQTEKEKQALQRRLDAVEGESRTLYTGEELDEAREAGRQEGISSENSRLLMQIQSDMESGGSTASMLRKLFPDDVVVVNAGKYYFYPILSSLPENPFSSGDFELNEAGRLVYKGSEGISMTSGIDVSAVDGEIDWTAVSEDDVAFAMICAGGRITNNPAGDADAGAAGTTDSGSADTGENESEGEDRNVPGTIAADESLSANISGAADAGLGVGVYWNLGAVSVDEAQEEADYLVQELEKDQNRITLPVAVCLNVPADTDRTAGQSRSTWDSYVREFCSTISEAGYQPMVYGNLAALVMLSDPQRLQDYPRWIANSGASLYFPYDFSMWQYSSNGAVQGIAGDVHLDVRISRNN